MCRMGEIAAWRRLVLAPWSTACSWACRELVGESTEVLDHARVEALERRQQLVAHAGAQVARVAVRRIDGVGEVVAGDVGVHVAAARAMKRADPVTVLRRQHTEALGAGAPEQPNEQRLGPVIGMVAGGDPIGADSGCGGTQGIPSSHPRPRLEVSPWLQRDFRAGERHIERPRKGLGQVELVCRLGAQAVVDAVGEEAESVAAAEQGEHVHHGRRIRTAAHGRKHESATRDEPVFTERCARKRDEGRRV
jgi:hypothetical protein